MTYFYLMKWKKKKCKFHEWRSIFENSSSCLKLSLQEFLHITNKKVVFMRDVASTTIVQESTQWKRVCCLQFFGCCFSKEYLFKTFIIVHILYIIVFKKRPPAELSKRGVKTTFGQSQSWSWWRNFIVHDVAGWSLHPCKRNPASLTCTMWSVGNAYISHS